MAKRTVESVKAEYARLVDTVRSNKQLTDEGKRQHLARAYTRAGQEIEALNAEADRTVQTERRTLEQRFMGAGPLPLGASASERIARDASFRDALERASATSTPDDLLSLFQRANTVQDPLMVRAALTVAVERGEVPVVNAWLDDHPSDDGPMNRLFELKAPPDIKAQMLAGLASGPPEVPAELQHMGPVQIADIADGVAQGAHT